jgi:hypothetical protein
LFYGDGALVETINSVVTDDLVLNYFGRIGGGYISARQKDVAFFNTALNLTQIQNLYNNPNDFISLSRSYGADRIYACTEGIYEDANPVIDLSTSGNHGTFLTSAAGSYDAALNNVEVGLQSGTHGFSLPYYLDGSTNEIDLNTSIVPATGDFEIEFTYVYQASSVANRYVFSQGADLASFFALQNQGSLNRLDFSPNGTTTSAVQFTSVTENQSYQIKFTRVGDTFSFFVDDVLVGSREVVGHTVPTNSDTFIGKSSWTSGRNVPGIIYGLKLDGTELYDAQWNPLTGNPAPTVTGSPTTRRILSTSDTGTTDLFGNTTQYPWGNGKFNGWGGLHGGTGTLNLGNSQTLALAIKEADASVDQTIFESGTPADVTISGSDITCAAFSQIEVDGAASQTITDNTWHYVELQNATPVELDALEISAGFDGEIIPFVVTSDQITAGESTNLQTYMEGLE